MWFPAVKKCNRDYILHTYGCGTIATADFFLYLALRNTDYRTPETEIALRGGNAIYLENYESYVQVINNNYTKTRRFLAVLGTRIAAVINEYCELYSFGFQAVWKLRLTYYDMLDMMEDMLSQDIPVILSIGPNTPKLWGKKGIVFYTLREIELPKSDSAPVKNPYYYKAAVTDVNSHYVTVTGVIKDDVTNRIMLRISSWGRQYYINYEEYWDYVDNVGGTFTSSIVRVKKFYR